MTEPLLYPMAIYSPKGEMLIVENDEERAAAVAQWEFVPEAGDIETPDEVIKRGPGRPKKIA